MILIIPQMLAAAELDTPCDVIWGDQFKGGGLHLRIGDQCVMWQWCMQSYMMEMAKRAQCVMWQGWMQSYIMEIAKSSYDNDHLTIPGHRLSIKDQCVMWHHISWRWQREPSQCVMWQGCMQWYITEMAKRAQCVMWQGCIQSYIMEMAKNSDDSDHLTTGHRLSIDDQCVTNVRWECCNPLRDQGHSSLMTVREPPGWLRDQDHSRGVPPLETPQRWQPCCTTSQVGIETIYITMQRCKPQRCEPWRCKPWRCKQ